VATETPQPADNPLFQELLWVHSMIRRDLDKVRELARDCAAGADAAELREEIANLKTNGPLWQLKVNCLHYCRFVHSHHRAEDVMIFPTLRKADPELEPVVDKLEADHREVAKLLDRVEAAADSLTADEDPERRAELVSALSALATTLLAHLDFEERSLEAPLGRMRSWAG
jgi:hypothetical protein